MAKETEGLSIARARIAREAEARTGFLDLGMLGLTALPEELFALKHLRRLLLGGMIEYSDGTYTSGCSDIAPNKLDIFLCRLHELTSLESLAIGDMELEDLSPLGTLRFLTILSFVNTSISNLSPLLSLSKLQSLDCRNTDIESLSPLTKLPNLQWLYCSLTSVSDLSSLSCLTALKLLDCGSTNVIDLSPLSSLSSLQWLYCGHTQVTDLSPLAGLATLQRLCCDSTQVIDLSPLAKLPQLRDLNFSGCQLTVIPEGFWDKPLLRRLDLYEATLPGIPTEVLGWDCLPHLRAHLQDLKAGPAELADVKLIVLGNGRAGKTQICRRLKGEDYDEGVSSTHGIEVSSVPRSGAAGAWNIWDFGGQDIYHGTHALFMKTRAVFLLVWAKETEEAGEHEHGGMVFRNYPLGYWLEYVRHLAGPDSPVIVLQTRCDRPQDEALRPPLEDAALAGFAFRKLLHYSAKENRGWAALDEALAEAAAWLRASQIGAGRLAVQRRLEQWRDEAKANPEYRTLSQARFRALCAETGGVSEPAHLLDYLHNAGVVFYRPRLFNDAIILDQGWALEAIYAVFHRDKSYKPLRQLGGRFTRSLLEALVWAEFGEAEQKVFLGMMESCGVCFVHRRGDEEKGIETEYIAPDLLPAREMVAQAWAWDGGEEAAETREFVYALYHPGLLRGLMAEIGGEAGVNAVYWQGGLAFYEQTTRSHAWIEQVAGEGWGGGIRIKTAQGQAVELMERLAGRLRKVQEYWGLKAVENVTIHARPGRLEFRGGTLDLREKMAKSAGNAGNAPLRLGSEELIPAYEGLAAREALDIRPEPVAGREICVSYAWADDTPEGRARGEVVERFCAAAEKRGIKIIRDKTELGLGDSLTRFMQRIGSGKRVVVVLSDAYLKSANCMYELFEIWRNSRMDKEEFKQRAGVYRLDCAKIFKLSDRARYAAYWLAQHDEVKTLLAEQGPDILSEEGFKEYKRMQDFAHQVEGILNFFKDTLHPGRFEELERHELDGED